MLELFDYERRRGQEIAGELGRESPPTVSLLTPEEVARVIIETIEHPVPEVFTHPGSREFALQFEQNQEATEFLLEPYWIANREGHQRREEK
jgi:hypothetical protein